MCVYIHEEHRLTLLKEGRVQYGERKKEFEEYSMRRVNICVQIVKAE